MPGMIPVDTQALLKEVQDVLEKTTNRELVNAAESVLSALVVVLRRRRAMVPEALLPHIAAIVRRQR